MNEKYDIRVSETPNTMAIERAFSYYCIELYVMGHGVKCFKSLSGKHALDCNGNI